MLSLRALMPTGKRAHIDAQNHETFCDKITRSLAQRNPPNFYVTDTESSTVKSGMMGMCVGAPIFVGANSPECCCFASSVLIDLELCVDIQLVCCCVFGALFCTQLAATPALLCFKNPNEFVTVSEITRTYYVQRPAAV